jgi:hypothetical protein
MALRIGMVWIPIMLAVGLVEFYIGRPDPNAQGMTPQAFVQLMTGIISIIAVCSMAVSWHRFILRDELPAGLRVDGSVLRYAGNTLLIMLAMLVPGLVLLTFVMLASPAAAILGLPLIVLAGGAVTRASIKLPAVALGDTAFSFRDAWKASEGNFWPCAGVFLLNAAILLAILVVLTMFAGFLDRISAVLSIAFQLGAIAFLQLFYAIFNASIFTSLYGFFVERRDF